MHLAIARLGNLTVGANSPVAVMGVINCDPNSFFRASYYRTKRLAIAAAERMHAEQVDIIDVGGASTAPGAHPVSAEVERNRVAALVKEIA